VPGDRVQLVVPYHRSRAAGVDDAPRDIDRPHLRRAAINDVAYEEDSPFRVAPGASHLVVSSLRSNLRACRPGRGCHR
jgi:hypothetical protein